MNYNKESSWYKFFAFIKSIFLRGFFTLLPIVITLTFFNFSFKLIKGWLEPVYHYEPVIFQQIPHSEIIFTFIIILGLGTLLRYFFLDNFIHNIENSLLNRIPFLRQVYFGAKQLIQAFQAEDKFTFKTVVLIEFPRKGIYSIAFLTGEAQSEAFSPLEKGRKYYSVFVPTTPNPTTGTCIIIPAEECHPINLSRQDAMALIISGGIIHPESAIK